MEKEFNNNVTVNICELSSELANKRVFEHFRFYNSGKSEDEIEEMILVVDLDTGDTFYTDEAQKLFNKYYDSYWTIIEKLAL